MLSVHLTIWYTQKVNSNKVILPSSQPYKFEKASFCLYPPPPSPSHVEADFWLSLFSISCCLLHDRL